MNHEYNKHEGHHTEDFLKKFWIALALSVPLFFYSEMAREMFGFNATHFSGEKYFLLILGSIIYFYGGMVFINGAYNEIRAKLIGMMTLITIAISTAYFYSLFSVIANTGHDLFFELSSLIVIMLLGHYIEMRAVKSTEGALKEISKLLPDTAEVIREEKTISLPISQLVVGDIVLVKPGAKVPADGMIMEGESEINESIITGESKPITKTTNDEVIAGSMNGDGSLKIKVTKIGENTFIAGVSRLVSEAETSKSRLQLLSDKAAFYLTIIAVLSGSATFLFWFFAKAGVAFSVERMVAVLVIACPHALGLAVPLVASISTKIAAQNGFLVKRRLALESAKNIDMVLFDKTGTLTSGEFSVTSVIQVNCLTKKEVLMIAASVNSQSEHLLAKAILAKAVKEDIILKEITSFKRIPAKGVQAVIDGQEVYVGNDKLFLDLNIQPTEDYKDEVSSLRKEGKTVVHVIAGGKLIGGIALGDIIKFESREAIAKIKALGIKVAMVTGDSEEVASFVAKELAIETYFAEVTPEQKVEKAKLLQEQGFKVAMVGDGVNDAPALAQADVGIAVGAGTNIAIESAGIILMKNDPRDIPKIIRLSKLTYVKMLQNIFWATGYNVIAIPLAGGILISKGVMLQPAVAAIFMSVSTVVVVLNALLLRNKHL